MGCNKITFNLEISHKKEALNSGRLLIRYTQNRKHKRVSTCISIAPKYWDKVHNKIKPSHPQSVDLKNLIQEKMRMLM